jgi:hypothetical protein
MMNNAAVILLVAKQWRKQGFERLCETMQTANASVTFPGTSRVSMLNAQGTQVWTDRSELKHRIESGVESSFQFWLNEECDIYCRVIAIGSCIAIEVALDGLTDREKRRVVVAMSEEILGLSEEGVALALIFDVVGERSVEEWAAMVQFRSGGGMG